MNLTLLQRNMRAIALSACAFAALGSYAQDVTIIEAEDPADATYMNTGEYAGFSGGHGINFNAYKGGHANYIFDAPQAGTYDVTVYYATRNNRWITIQVGNQPAHAVCCNELTPNWDGTPGVSINPETNEEETIPGVASKTVQVYMEAGENTIQLTGIYGLSSDGSAVPDSPNIDKIGIKYSNTHLGVVEDAPEQIVIEAEDAVSFIGNAGAGNADGISGNKYAHTGTNGSLVYKVNAPVTGAYMLRVYYATRNTRWVYTKVGEQKRSYIEFAAHTDTWTGATSSNIDEHPGMFQRNSYIWLDKGENELIIGNYTGFSSQDDDSPNIDRFTIDLIDFPTFTKPDVEILAQKNSLIDVVKNITASSDIDKDVLTDHNERTGFTLDGKKDLTVTAEMACDFLFTGYSVATTNSIDDWTVEVSADGETWNTPTIAGTSKIGTITTVSFTNPYSSPSPAKYIRIVATGDDDINLSDWEIYGNPYVTDSKQFPEGILKDGEFEIETNNNGLESWGETSDKLFDGNAQTRYTATFGGQNIEIEVRPTNETTAVSYMITTAYHDLTERNPSAWKLMGLDEEDNWVVLDEQKSISFVTKGSTLFFPIKNPVACSAYKLVVPSRSQTFHFSQWQLFEEEQNVVTAISTIKTEDNATVAISVCDGKITLSSDKAANYNIYSLQGVNVATGVVQGTSNVSLPTGIYLVKVGNKVIKAAVK